MSNGETIDRLLDTIPGYGGYRDKERRRESDRRIREHLALDYGQLTDRLSRLATRIAEERQLQAIQLVDKPRQRLSSFVDRVRTATYGYAGLFSDNPVDENALDQIAAFDQALNDQVPVLDEMIGQLEQADPASSEFKQHSERLSEAVEGLHTRFDRRREAVDSGKALPPARVAGLLDPTSAARPSPTAYNLHERDAVVRAGENYSVVGRISIQTPEASWHDFQLKGGDGDHWLSVPAAVGDSFAWLRRVTVPASLGSEMVEVEDRSYTLQRRSEGTGEVIGVAGGSGSQPVTVYQYQATTGDGLLRVYDWGVDQVALAGETIDPLEIEIFSKEGGSAV
jgi:hypothetical protein